MQIYTELNRIPNLSLALGFFDGVHLGHKTVIQKAVDYAQKNNTKSAVITFKDHPFCYLKNTPPKYILTGKDRREKIKALGVDYLFELDFKDIVNLSADEYLKNILVNYFQPSAISTGWNHNFGCNKSGNVKLLKEKSSEFNYHFFELEPQKINNEIISSSLIRKFLQISNIEKANKMLGYNFFVSGKVVEGNKIGRTIGFKTANIEYPKELIELPYGVYNVKTNYGKGIANFGIRPTIDGTSSVLEVHILDFDGDIYGETITVEFSRMLRPERKFNSLDELKKQIKTDISKIISLN